jgi:glyoxalase/bleomycin resistance protein/dioxygenase superfamily protein
MHPLLPSVENCNHVAYVVPDLAEAMKRLTASAGLRWAAPRKLPVLLRTPAGEIPTEVNLTYSVQGPPHIELIAEQPGTIWGSEHHGFHHMGYWSGRFADDIEALTGAGFEFDAGGVNEHGALTGFAYLREPHTGLRVELRDEARKPATQRWLLGEAR